MPFDEDTADGPSDQGDASIDWGLGRLPVGNPQRPRAPGKKSYGATLDTKIQQWRIRAPVRCVLVLNIKPHATLREGSGGR